MNGKGDTPRKVDQEKFDNSWNRIFRGHNMTISEPNASRIRDFFAEEDKYLTLQAQVAQARWYAINEEEYIALLAGIQRYSAEQVQYEVNRQDQVLSEQLKAVSKQENYYEA